jgi:hypothetical protein
MHIRNKLNELLDSDDHLGGIESYDYVAHSKCCHGCDGWQYHPSISRKLKSIQRTVKLEYLNDCDIECRLTKDGKAISVTID